MEGYEFILKYLRLSAEACGVPLLLKRQAGNIQRGYYAL